VLVPPYWFRPRLDFSRLRDRKFPAPRIKPTKAMSRPPVLPVITEPPPDISSPCQWTTPVSSICSMPLFRQKRRSTGVPSTVTVSHSAARADLHPPLTSETLVQVSLLPIPCEWAISTYCRFNPLSLHQLGAIRITFLTVSPPGYLLPRILRFHSAARPPEPFHFLSLFVSQISYFPSHSWNVQFFRHCSPFLFLVLPVPSEKIPVSWVIPAAALFPSPRPA